MGSVISAGILFFGTLVVLYFDSAHHDGCEKHVGPCEPFAVLGYEPMTVVGTLLIAACALLVYALIADSIKKRSWW